MAMTMWRSVRATPEEKLHALPGDELIKEPIGSLDHAITLRRSRDRGSLGRGSRRWALGIVRAGPAMTFSTTDAGRALEHIIPELQKLAVGMIFSSVARRHRRLHGARLRAAALSRPWFDDARWRTPHDVGLRPRRWRARLDAPYRTVRAPDRDTAFTGCRGGRRSASLRRFTSSCSGNNCSVSPGASRGAPLSRCAVANSHESSLHSGSVLRGLRAAAGVLNTDASPIPAFA